MKRIRDSLTSNCPGQYAEADELRSPESTISSSALKQSYGSAVVLSSSYINPTVTFLYSHQLSPSLRSSIQAPKP
ncbi:hypothetical protein KSP39_PZI003700 [Platanthera zijinensis]|uniref:Uncharacterized protein n=1 Tax=Platanthera zijinensis TaxID=2320716 RepID=A0AAP0GBZ3_9ASPA